MGDFIPHDLGVAGTRVASLARAATPPLDEIGQSQLFADHQFHVSDIYFWLKYLKTFSQTHIFFLFFFFSFFADI